MTTPGYDGETTGTCAACGATVEVRAGGAARPHRDRRLGYDVRADAPCTGSGRPAGPSGVEHALRGDGRAGPAVCGACYRPWPCPLAGGRA